MTGSLLAPLLLLGLAGGGPDPGALAREVLALSASGDPVRLARAASSVPDARLGDPAYRGAAAGRVLARLLLAASLRESAAASPEGGPGLYRSRALQEEALEELRPLVQAAPDDPDVLRSLCVYYGLDGRPEEVARLCAPTAGGGTEADPWLDFAALSATARGLPPSEVEPLLASFVAAHPGIHPPRLSLVRARLALGNRDGALAALDDLLSVDPDHEAAREAKAALLAPPPAVKLAPRVPSTAPPQTSPGYLPRKAPRAGSAPRRPWPPRAAAWRRGARRRRTW